MALSLQRYTESYDDNLLYLLKERRRMEKERSMNIKKGDHMPESLIIEILSWLPVNDLLRFKSVCKSWYAIISSSDFISNHLKNYYNNNYRWRNCLLFHHYVSYGELQLHELLLDETPRVIADEVLYNIPIYCSYICGPCEGIYYLNEHNFCARALWNPVTNELIHLPPLVAKPNLPSNICYMHVEGYGFGLDPLTKDFKVVAIKTHCTTTGEDLPSMYPHSVYVYSLWTNSWRYIGDLSRDFRLQENKCYTYSNGFYYWLGSYKEEDVRKEVVISFDMATDVYKEMHVPDYSQPSSNCIGIYDECLALLTFQTIDKIFDIWTLKEGSWIKKLTMGPLPDIWNPIGHWKDNCILLECHYGKLVLLDSESQELKDLAYQYERTCRGVFAYMESLVSIKDKTMPGLQLEELKPEHDQSCCKN
ncbi:F-box protein At3g08750-like [Beta vulgaris subsp. vulgaris]|uniref:F-box protein At3g08750-like n=1 Tax=Beta vulgaris subsp. vulgaris TaxID=3555 RepID=UPI0020372D37|nr:F-box protein At3g08750-like [Beta vulgaris subsp. vulgaris]XP_057247710.1 F-box protein At3g08750-like [Beta vulgaris subsp. vulgaris]